MEFFFQSNFRFTAKLSRKYKEFPCPSSSLPARTASPTISSPAEGTSVTANESVLSHHSHSKFVVSTRARYQSCTFVGLGKWIMTRTHHNSTTEQFQCLRIPCLSPLFPLIKSLATTHYLMCPQFHFFPEFQIVRIRQCVIFLTDFTQQNAFEFPPCPFMA